MTREQQKQKLIQFLKTIQRPDYPLDLIDENEGLINSGLIDSLSLLEIIVYLEEEYNIDFKKRGIDPGELYSISSILSLIEQTCI